MKILLDTNFILACARQKIDIGRKIDEVTSEAVDWIVPQDVLNELGNIKDKAGGKVADRNAATLGFEILQGLNPEIVELPGKNPNVDIKIVNYILGTDIVLATLDRGLKSRVRNRVLTVRGKRGLEIV